MIILCKMHNREKFIGTYGKLVPSLVEKHGGEYLIVAPGATLLEGSLFKHFLQGPQLVI